ncbi:hypothetical protein PanWU01x14_169490 [Parasponia andersonii]|uniref:Uncharacterized protein n=1 Tax=Parasponia andersonii TaxID=3476 RepID=A0A2P5CAF3_PARAD|nr:hypothetical protein PanWU01x14_169490 [Parasponia andersonii]
MQVEVEKNAEEKSDNGKDKEDDAKEIDREADREQKKYGNNNDNDKDREHTGRKMRIKRKGRPIIMKRRIWRRRQNRRLREKKNKISTEDGVAIDMDYEDVDVEDIIEKGVQAIVHLHDDHEVLFTVFLPSNFDFGHEIESRTY